MLEKTKRILERLEIPVTYQGQDYVACSTEYRQGNTSTGLLCRDTHVFDVVSQQRMDWVQLVSKVKRISESDAKKWLAGAEIQSGEEEFEEKVDKIEMEKTLNEADYQTVKSYDFFLKRGLSKETLDFFGVGLAMGGGMYGRVIAKIRDERGKLIGVTGRDVLGRHEKGLAEKWKHKGKKSKWIYPCFEKNLEAIQRTGQIILVESLGDAYALCEAGYWNVLCLFGLSISSEKISHILKMNPKMIFLALNNDNDKEENRGQIGAEKVAKKLQAFFEQKKIVNAPPTRGDFGDMLKEGGKEEIWEWAEQYGVLKYE